MQNVMANGAAVAAGQAPVFYATALFGALGCAGGSGNTLPLVLMGLRSKSEQLRAVSKVALIPGIFNINEPVIYGYPIVYNLPLIIPFVVVPDLLIAATYGLTCIGLISPCVVMVPWTTPVLLSGWLATAGDFRAVIWQVIEIAVSMAIYLPFMKISERAQAKQLENASEEE